ncbi:group-specific protein [Sporosarcina sp. HYO08]|uniref:group-specific protein n=1 Tax=Sporosarcina sp. HYO08 TaxID=1759557 RepID=UPI00079976F5|nr:group-specific protein [Sporosarcina sp. HYO08]KXH81820.1 group-specific protein [Sporosarcina sp. HYO08]
MSKCTIDHSIDDVRKKLEEQRTFLPKALYEKYLLFLNEQRDQATLNEVFHLLKKYDLASEEVREERNAGLRKLI